MMDETDERYWLNSCTSSCRNYAIAKQHPTAPKVPTRSYCGNHCIIRSDRPFKPKATVSSCPNSEQLAEAIAQQFTALVAFPNGKIGGAIALRLCHL